jgi:hypothetical protein
LAIGRAGGVLVGPRAREAVGRTAVALEHVAGVVGAVLDLVLGRDRLHLGLGITEPGQVAERDEVEAVTDRADLLVNLEAALELAAVELAERAGERPLVARRHRLIVFAGGVGRGDRGKARDGACEDEGENGAHGRSPSHRGTEPAAGLRIDSAIEFGSGLVFSIQPRIGRMMMK